MNYGEKNYLDSDFKHSSAIFLEISRRIFRG